MSSFSRIRQSIKDFKPLCPVLEENLENIEYNVEKNDTDNSVPRANCSVVV